MKNKTRDIVITIIVMLLIVAGVIFALQLVHKENETKKIAEMSEAQHIIAKDLETDYPATCRDVVKFYNRIMKCYYSEKMTDEELAAVAGQARMLFDTELLKRNPYEDYLKNLKKEIDAYKKAERRISNTDLQPYEDIVFEEKGGYETAQVISYYLIKEKSHSGSEYMKFYLRLDEEGKWRILFWENTDETF